MTNRQAYNLNKQIEALIEEKGRIPSRYSAEEKAMLAQYSGYGGLDKLMDESNAGILYEFFTPLELVKAMWGLAITYGFRGGPVLEPAAGAGVFLSQVPAKGDKIFNFAPVTAIEPSPVSAAILSILYPQARVIEEVFEQQFISAFNESVKAKVTPQYKLVIGNPPYGSIRGLTGGKYMNMGEKAYTKANAYDEYFITRGLDVLLPSGLLVYIIGSEVANGGVPFLQRGNSEVKERIADKAELIDAYRLPNGVFDRTDVLSDIVVFRKNR